MRAAMTVVIAVVAACGGGAKQKPIENVAVVQAQPWTMDRVRATLPPDTGVVAKVNTGAIRASEIAGPLWTQLSAESMKKAPCPEMKDLDVTALIVGSGTEANPVISIWLFDTSMSALKACMEKVAAAPTGELRVAVDGDFMSITNAPGGFRGGFLILDQTTAVMTFAKTPTLDRAQLLAQSQERSDGFHDPALDQLFASSAPIWGYGTAAAPLLATTASGKFRAFAVTIELAALLSVDARVQMATPDEASVTARMIQDQGQGAVQMGMADELRASSEADVVVVHAAFSKAAITKMMSMMGPMLGGGGGAGPMPPTP